MLELDVNRVEFQRVFKDDPAVFSGARRIKEVALTVYKTKNIHAVPKAPEEGDNNNNNAAAAGRLEEDNKENNNIDPQNPAVATESSTLPPPKKRRRRRFSNSSRGGGSLPGSESMARELRSRTASLDAIRNWKKTLKCRHCDRDFISEKYLVQHLNATCVKLCKNTFNYRLRTCKGCHSAEFETLWELMDHASTCGLGEDYAAADADEEGEEEEDEGPKKFLLKKFLVKEDGDVVKNGVEKEEVEAEMMVDFGEEDGSGSDVERDEIESTDDATNNGIPNEMKTDDQQTSKDPLYCAEKFNDPFSPPRKNAPPPPKKRRVGRPKSTSPSSYGGFPKVLSNGKWKFKKQRAYNDVIYGIYVNAERQIMGLPLSQAQDQANQNQ